MRGHKVYLLKLKINLKVGISSKHYTCNFFQITVCSTLKDVKHLVFFFWNKHVLNRVDKE